MRAIFSVVYPKTSILLLFAIVSLGAPLRATPPPSNARVSLTSQRPLEVRGSGFAPQEHVTVTVRVLSEGKKFTQMLTTSDAGSFVAVWGISATGNDPCINLFVNARGDHGSKASCRSIAENCADGPAD